MNDSVLTQIVDRLAGLSETPTLDASVLLADILDRSRTWVVAHPELSLTEAQKCRVDDSLKRLEQGEPLPHVIGRREFFGLEFEVTADVLIPRPETELLVERGIAWLEESAERKAVADIGTGSGIIAVSIAVRVPDVQVLATDISRAALEVARGNAHKFTVRDRIDFLQCDLLPGRAGDAGTGRFDLICANLPYIPTQTLRGLPIFGREPTLALDGGADGLDHIRRLLEAAPPWLAPGGMILIELEATNAVKAHDLACDLFASGAIVLHKDLAGRDRLLEITLQGYAH